MSDPGGVGGKSWVNTRARVQRFSDGRFFAGPVTRDVAGGLTVALPEGTVEVGDECSIQLFGWTTSIVYATCVLAENGSVNFRTDKIVHSNRPAPSEPRLVNRDLMATLRTGDDLLSVSVQDTSPTGMGVLCDKALPKDCAVAVNVRMNDRVLRFNGHVVNCVQSTTHTYRIGIKLGVATIEDKEAWLEQFDSIS